MCVCVWDWGRGLLFLTPLSDDFSPLSLRRVLQQRVFNSTREVFSLPSFLFDVFSFLRIFRRRSKKVEVPPSISRRHNSRLPPSFAFASRRWAKRRKKKSSIFRFDTSKKIGNTSHSQIYQQYYTVEGFHTFRVSKFSSFSLGRTSFSCIHKLFPCEGNEVTLSNPAFLDTSL